MTPRRGRPLGGAFGLRGGRASSSGAGIAPVPPLTLGPINCANMLFSDSHPAAACASACVGSDDSWLIFTMTKRSDRWRRPRLTWADYRSTFPVSVCVEAVIPEICRHGAAVDYLPFLSAVLPGIGKPEQMRRSTETFPAHANRSDSVVAFRSQGRYVGLRRAQMQVV